MSEKDNIIEKIKDGSMRPTPPSLIISDLIDDKSNTKLETITGNSICQIIYSAFSEIYMRYSDHSEKYPSFKGFEITYHDVLNDEKCIKIKAFNNEFTMKLTKLPDAYSELTNYNTRFKIYCEDNMVVVSMGICEKKVTVCEIIPIVIPYAFLDATNAVIAPANESNYKDLHDTIFGFNLLILPICYGETTCKDPDIFRFEDGFEVAYKHALMNKINLDIENQKASVKHYQSRIDKYQKMLVKSNRILRRSKKSLKRAKAYIQKTVAKNSK